MVRKILFAIGCVCVAALPAIAQQSATVVTRSGERVSGDLIDFNASGFVMNVGGGSRSFGVNDVASVEFQGRQLTAEQQAKLNAGQQFVLLNNGQVIDASVYDVSGTSPLKITVDTSSGRRDFMSNDVAGLYFANPPGTAAVATTGSAAAAGPVPAGAIIVPGNQQWTATNMSVRRGELIHFQTTGEVQFSTNPADHAQANGSVNRQQAASGAPLPSALVGALVGRVNNGPAFPIGQQTEVRMPSAGLLFIGINDDMLSDNSGQFNVIISR